MKKSISLIIRAALTIVLAAACVYILNEWEYISQLAAVDNFIGAAPPVLLLGIIGFLIALVWKRQILRRQFNSAISMQLPASPASRAVTAPVSTIVLSMLAILWGLLLIPAMTGNWYPLAVTQDYGTASPDLTVYAPFSPNTQAAELPDSASVAIHGRLPRLDGATALYPLYAAFANAVYNKADYTPDIVTCTNTANAYRSIISGGCDVIFVAQPSEKQKTAAEHAGADLVYTPGLCVSGGAIQPD